MMTATRDRLFGVQHAFDHPVTVGLTVAIAVALVAALLIVFVLRRAGRLDETAAGTLMSRCRSWVVLSAVIVGSILLGAAWVMLAVAVLSLLCYREFARATGLFRHHLISGIVVLGIAAVTFAVADHWYGLFVAITPLTVIILAAAAILPDHPAGYIQRVALGMFAFVFFGACLGHVGYMANDADFRPILLWLLLCVELNDVFAFLAGKLVGRRRLAPNTSPNKTVGGAVGAILATTALAAWIGQFVFRDDVLDQPLHLICLGLIISVTGQLGDLMLSSIKRDLGIKDMAATIPGHGGLLDRFDSLLLVAPAVFHYVGYFRGFGIVGQPTRIITGG